MWPSEPVLKVSAEMKWAVTVRPDGKCYSEQSLYALNRTFLQSFSSCHTCTSESPVPMFGFNERGTSLAPWRPKDQIGLVLVQPAMTHMQPHRPVQEHIEWGTVTLSYIMSTLGPKAYDLYLKNLFMKQKPNQQSSDLAWKLVSSWSGASERTFEGITVRWQETGGQRGHLKSSTWDLRS